MHFYSVVKKFLAVGTSTHQGHNYQAHFYFEGIAWREAEILVERGVQPFDHQTLTCEKPRGLCHLLDQELHALSTSYRGCELVRGDGVTVRSFTGNPTPN